ncbi:TorF family putative porin [Piscinibacter sp.]|uniref:TorF family putative porin n=1 Tax=Piscinibacter sp. TaxID=1903157 RepID=UPI002C9B9EB0|nr:TorF family putative porin [Albitalea sp.]HUG22575.1 TorF family putative porin [Albitalea sp.]
MKKSLVVVAVLSLFASMAQADVTANLSLTSKYKYRGQDQSDAEKDVLPAVQGGFDFSSGGLYLGNWNSSIGFAHGTEMDFYGGYKGEAGGLAYDVGVLQYYYPGTDASVLNTTELYGAVSFSIVTFKYSHTVSDEYFGIVDGQNTGYFDLTANYDLGNGLTLNGHLGHTRFPSGAKDVGAVNYTDYKLGVTYDLGSGFSLGGAVVGADKKDAWGDINKARAIVTLTKAM